MNPRPRHRASLLAAQYEASIDGILTVDTKGRLASFNTRFTQLWDVSPAVLSSTDGCALSVILDKVKDPEEFRERVGDYYRHRWKRGRDEISLKDGRVFERYTAPAFGGDGRYYGRVWFFRDVSERKRECAQRVLNEARYRELFDSVGDPVFVVDAKTRRIEDANRAALKRFGYARAELLALRAEELDEDPQAAGRALRGFARLGRWPRTSTRELKRKDGAPFPAEISAGRFYQGGKLKLIGTVRDVTDRRRAAQVELFRQQELLQRQFVATVSHELRTPIAAIRGFAETLATGALSDKKASREFVGTILKHSERIGRLVDDLLTLSLLESGRRKLQFEVLDARRFLEEFVAGIEPVALRRKRRLKVECESTLLVRADAGQLTQVLQNFVDNAMKFAPARSVVRVAASRDKGQAVFRVVDSGPGLPADQLEKVFEPFHRCEQSQKTPGAGLGLAIARQIVLSHGGRIWAESRPGRGAAFCFTMPAESRAAAALIASAACPAAS